MRDFEKHYRLNHPYSIWVYRKDGTKFKGHFKNKRDAENWASRRGTGVSLTKVKKKVKKQSRDMFGFPTFRFI